MVGCSIRLGQTAFHNRTQRMQLRLGEKQSLYLFNSLSSFFSRALLIVIRPFRPFLSFDLEARFILP